MFTDTQELINYLKTQIEFQKGDAEMWAKEIHAGCDCNIEQRYQDMAEARAEAYQDVLDRLQNKD